VKRVVKKSGSSRSKAIELRSWRVVLIRNRGQFLGYVEAPSSEAAELAAAKEFNLIHFIASGCFCRSGYEHVWGEHLDRICRPRPGRRRHRVAGSWATMMFASTQQKVRRTDTGKKTGSFPFCNELVAHVVGPHRIKE